VQVSVILLPFCGRGERGVRFGDLDKAFRGVRIGGVAVWVVGFGEGVEGSEGGILAPALERWRELVVIRRNEKRASWGRRDSLLHLRGRGSGGYLESLIVILLGDIISSRSGGVKEPWEPFPYERRGEWTEWHSSSRTKTSRTWRK